MFAGHEANANTLTFAILLLACHPSLQQLLQDDIDNILGRSAYSHQNWCYESLYPLLSESMVGAIINEALRIATVLPFLPKAVPKDSPQSINISNSTHVIPANTLVLINTSAVHRHPKFWPEPRSPLSPANNPNPVASFNPQHWLPSRDTLSEKEGRSKSLLQPQPGTFVPFSDGSRGCLGKKFALVELCALITRIFSEYSVELAVKGLKFDADRVEMKREWDKARAVAEHNLSAGVEFGMSLRLTAPLPVTFVKRGEERFAQL